MKTSPEATAVVPSSFRTLVRSLASLLAAASFASLPGTAVAANYGSEVVQYAPGTGAAPGYDQTSAVLGEPSRVTPGEFGGPVDPFSSPWQAGQLLSVGAGGSLTVRFAEPVRNLATHPFGLDFQIFGSAAFVIVNGDFTGGGITDGSMFGDNSGQTRVSVSADGASFFTLDPLLAPVVDGLFPTDGLGDFSKPVNPALGATAFSGRDLTGLRSLYDGSGGGTGFDLAWARDPAGKAIQLDLVNYVRVEVLSGRSEIDAVAGIPEPGIGSLVALGAACLLRRRAAARRSA